ncbi:MAG: peptidase M61, partial [Lysobacterales bacterium]
PGLVLVGVNGRRWSETQVREAVRDSTRTSAPLELLVENGDFYRLHQVDYHGGGKYPALERKDGKLDLLSMIIAPRQP